MKRPLILFFSLFLVLATALAYAGDIAALKQKIVEARCALYIMLYTIDKRDADQQKQVKNTADAVSAHLATLKAPAGKEAQFKELAATWKAFKKTREEELVPRILAGKQAEAEKIATGVQSDRFKKMMELCEKLEK
jgi:hypothetical protein